MIKKFVFYCVALLLIQQLLVSSLFFVGLVSISAPLEVQQAAIAVFPKNSETNLDRYRNRSQTVISSISTAFPRVAAFDDLRLSNQTRLPSTWKVLTSKDGITKEQLNSNVCFQSSRLGSHVVQCLPSLYIVGFEKCGTTALNIWLSYHPNLKASWLESRFFDLDQSQIFQHLDTKWRDYVASLPKISKNHQIGKIWTLEKSPAYAVNPWAPKFFAELVPSAKILMMTRNPTLRAYSMFLMYTQHYPDTWSAIRRQPMSFFVKNVNTGDVRFVSDSYHDKQFKDHPLDLPPGIGGQMVPSKIAPTKDKWQYLSYPPDPKDFDNFIQYAIQNHKPIYFQKPYSRDRRILVGGLYSAYLQSFWLKSLDPEHFVILPSEEFFHADHTLESLTKLQTLLGLPVFDFSRISSRNLKTGRLEIPSSLGTMLNTLLNSYVGESLPMLPETRRSLDDFYCESNRNLSRMLGNRTLLGYSCADPIPWNQHNEMEHKAG